MITCHCALPPPSTVFSCILPHHFGCCARTLSSPPGSFLSISVAPEPFLPINDTWPHSPALSTLHRDHFLVFWAHKSPFSYMCAALHQGPLMHQDALEPNGV